MRARTLTLRPWQIARHGGQREGRAAIPEGDRPPPIIPLLGALGRMELAESGQRWWKEAARLEAGCHTASHACERAALATDAAKDALVGAAPLAGDDNDGDQPSMVARRELSTTAYRLVLLGLAVGEAYFSYLSLLALGEDRLRWAGVLTLGIALLVLARALGAGWRQLRDEQPGGLTRAGLAVGGLAAAGLVVAQALLRSQAVSIVVSSAMDASAGAIASSPPTVHVAPWWIYALLQAAIFIAAAWASWAHTNPLADLADRQRAERRHLERRLNRALDGEQHAADQKSKALLRWAAAFAARGQEAERAQAFNAACQHRYWHFNLLARDKSGRAQVRQELALVPASGWRATPALEQHLGAGALPRIAPVWSRFSNACAAADPNANGHREPSPSWRPMRPDEVGA